MSVVSNKDTVEAFAHFNEKFTNFTNFMKQAPFWFKKSLTVEVAGNKFSFDTADVVLGRLAICELVTRLDTSLAVEIFRIPPVQILHPVVFSCVHKLVDQVLIAEFPQITFNRKALIETKKQLHELEKRCDEIPIKDETISEAHWFIKFVRYIGLFKTLLTLEPPKEQTPTA